jgi:hypothetical protein
VALNYKPIVVFWPNGRPLTHATCPVRVRGFLSVLCALRLKAFCLLECLHLKGSSSLFGHSQAGNYSNCPSTCAMSGAVSSQ